MLYKIDFAAYEWEAGSKGVRHKCHIENGRKLRLLEFSRGFVEPDWCRKGHIGYILEGAMDLDINGTIVHFAAGDGVFIPGGETAKHKALVEDYVKLILVEDV